MAFVASVPLLYALFWIMFPTAAAIYTVSCWMAGLAVAMFPSQIYRRHTETR